MIMPKQEPALEMGSEKKKTHQNKGCTITKGADGSSSTDGNMAEDIRINARSNQNEREIRWTKLTKNMTNDKGCRRIKGAGA